MGDKDNYLDFWLEGHFFPRSAKKTDGPDLKKEKIPINNKISSSDSLEIDSREEELKRIKEAELKKWTFLKEAAEEKTITEEGFLDNLSKMPDVNPNYQSLLKEIPAKISFLNIFFQKVRKEAKGYLQLIESFNRELKKLAPSIKAYNKDIALYNMRPESEERMRFKLINAFDAKDRIPSSQLKKIIDEYNLFAAKRNALIDQINDSISYFNRKVKELNEELKDLNRFREELRLGANPKFQSLPLVQKMKIVENEELSPAHYLNREEIPTLASLAVHDNPLDTFFTSPYFLSKLSIITLSSSLENLNVLRDSFSFALGEPPNESALMALNHLALSNYVNIYVNQSVPLLNTLENFLKEEKNLDKETIALKFKLFALSLLFYAGLLGAPHALSFLNPVNEIKEGQNNAIYLASATSFASMILEIIKAPYLSEEIREVFNEFFVTYSEQEKEKFFKKIKQVLVSSLSISAFMAVSYALKSKGFTKQISSLLTGENKPLPKEAPYDLMDLLEETAIKLEIKNLLSEELITLGLEEDKAINLADKLIDLSLSLGPYNSLVEYTRSLSIHLQLEGLPKQHALKIAFNVSSFIQRKNPFVPLVREDEDLSFYWPLIESKGFSYLIGAEALSYFMEEEVNDLVKPLEAIFKEFNFKKRVLLSTLEDRLFQELLKLKTSDEAFRLANAYIAYFKNEKLNDFAKEAVDSEYKLFLSNIENGLQERNVSQADLSKWMLLIQEILYSYPSISQEEGAGNRILKAIDKGIAYKKHGLEINIENILEITSQAMRSLAEAIKTLLEGDISPISFTEALKLGLKTTLRDKLLIINDKADQVAGFASLTLAASQTHLKKIIFDLIGNEEDGLSEKASSIAMSLPASFESPLNFKYALFEALLHLGMNPAEAQKKVGELDLAKLWGDEGGKTNFKTIFKAVGFTKEAEKYSDSMKASLIYDKETSLEEIAASNLTILLMNPSALNYFDIENLVEGMDPSRLLQIDEMKKVLIQGLQNQADDSEKVADLVFEHLKEEPFVFLSEALLKEAIEKILILYGGLKFELAKEVSYLGTPQIIWDKRFIKNQIEKELLEQGFSKEEAFKVSMQIMINLFIQQIPLYESYEDSKFIFDAKEQFNLQESALKKALNFLMQKKGISKAYSESLSWKVAHETLLSAQKMDSEASFRNILKEAFFTVLKDEASKIKKEPALTKDRVLSLVNNLLLTPNIRLEVLKESLLKILIECGFDSQKAPYAAIDLAASLSRSTFIFESESVFKKAVLDTINAWSLINYDLAKNEIENTSFGFARAFSDFNVLSKEGQASTVQGIANELYSLAQEQYEKIVDKEKAEKSASQLILILFGIDNKNQGKKLPNQDSLLQEIINGYEEFIPEDANNASLEMKKRAFAKDLKGFIHPTMESLIVLNRLFEPTNSLVYTLKNSSGGKQTLEGKWSGGVSV